MTEPNYEAALQVIDDRIKITMKNTYSPRGEDTVRAKLSDLRAVVLALRSPVEEEKCTDPIYNNWPSPTPMHTIHACLKCGMPNPKAEPNPPETLSLVNKFYKHINQFPKANSALISEGLCKIAFEHYFNLVSKARQEGRNEAKAAMERCYEELFGREKKPC